MLSYPEFQRLHEQHISSAWWKAFTKKARDFYNWECAICKGRGWIVDHKYYWKNGSLIFGHETYADVRLLCDRCNKKGVRSDYAIAQQRQTLAVIRFVDRCFSLAWVLLKLCLKLLQRLLKSSL